MSTNTAPKFDVQEFVIQPFSFDREKGIVELNYSFDGNISFCERIEFGKSCMDLSGQSYEALLHCLAYLQVAAGVSYYKAFIPKTIRIDGLPFDDDCAAFFKEFYEQGLGEFAYRNDVSLYNQIDFVYENKDIKAYDVELQNYAAVLFGGGKDSIISTKVLQQGKRAFSHFAVNPAQEITDGMNVADENQIIIQRHIDKSLFDLNKDGAYNGHVPITGILSFISVCASLIYDYDTIVLSNERSANEGNISIDGMDVNHQYSKSLEFEKAMAGFVKEKLLRKLNYFSILRPLSELQIAQQFLKFDEYDSVFTSCNANFKIHDKMSDGRWCTNCPKCRFSFLILAASLPKQRVLNIFGKNMLDDEMQRDGFAEILGLLNHKPWECVGEILESRLALWMVLQRNEWKTDKLAEYFTDQIEQLDDDFKALTSEYFTPVSDHLIPREYKEALDAFLD